MVSIDSFLESKPGPVSFVKIDVQGYELAVCQGMQNTLRKNLDITIVLEYTPSAMRELGFDYRIQIAPYNQVFQLLLDPARAPVTLIARGATAAQAAAELPLLRSTRLPLPTNAEPAWISEALEDLYGYKLGSQIELPLAGRTQRFTVAGIWRDYARISGSIVISRPAYIAATGDGSANEGSLWLTTGASAKSISATHAGSTSGG